MDKASIAESFARDGYVRRLPAIGSAAASEVRSALELQERQYGRLSAAHRNNPHLLFAWADALIRSPQVVDPIRTLYGDDLLVWGSTLFMKEPNDPGFVSWHQDSTYWGLDPADVVTAWIAISDSRSDNGALRIIPGSHLWDQIAHRDTFADSNMLSRGQEIAVDVDEEQAVILELEPGEMSLHHVRMVHGSEPNRSLRRRIGLAVRFLPTRVRQIGQKPDTATLVSGVDRFHHFSAERRPLVDFGSTEREFHALVQERTLAITMGEARAV